ncbi:TetR family transcriptional regulator [Frondihabitans sp. PhB188]|uniref:TetR/AcrR family transcriptional regulator n=1 Tax=Frondihabitans sp. PhB188 TaxID=2485200 RepID=UPI000F4616FF|nr:TetR/AcrR family transcriptional regulator [Frondihabitans sp. PhB188]ROQ39763.1 TetR family transcriptional regulator [Frondihabitans sp. PhB188]
MSRPGTYAKGAAKRLEILEAAHAVLAREGYRNSSLRSIARSLGMEPAHILYYFGSREELLREVIERWDADSRRAHESLDALDGFAEAVRRNVGIPGIVHTYLTFAAEAVDPAHPAHQYFIDRFERTRAELSAAIADGQVAGTLRAALDPDRTARTLIAVSDGLQLQALVDPGVDAVADMAAAMADLRV